MDLLITTHSQSIYRVTEKDGEFRFGAVEVPSEGFGTRFLGATYRVDEPSPWPPQIGEHFHVFRHEGETGFPSPTGYIRTSRVESVVNVTPAVAVDQADGAVAQ